MVEAKLIDVIEVGNTLGESVLWNTNDQSIWWTDIQKNQMFRFDWKTRKLVSYRTPERLCCFGFLNEPNKILAAFESGLALYDYKQQEVEWLYRLDQENPNIRFNDGRVDHHGRFWVGTMVEGGSPRSEAHLYRLSKQNDISIQAGEIAISNGICWSPDSQRFYFADSARQNIYVYDYDVRLGKISSPRVFAKTSGDSFPDGAAVDNDGFVWSAHWGGGCVVRYSPEGKEDFILKMPVTQPTCVAFGGDNMNLLFVSSAREALSEQKLANEPLAGSLFVYDLSVSGFPANNYQP